MINMEVVRLQHNSIILRIPKRIPGYYRLWIMQKIQLLFQQNTGWRASKCKTTKSEYMVYSAK